MRYGQPQPQPQKPFEILTNSTYYTAMIGRMQLVDYITENIFNNLEGQIDYSKVNKLFDIFEIKDPIIGMPFLSMITSNPDLNNTFIKIYDSSVNLSHPFIKGGKTKTVDLNEYLGLIKFGVDNPLNMNTVENQYQYNYTNPYGTIELDRMGFFEVPKGRLFSSALQDNYVPNSPYYKSFLALTMFGLYSIPPSFKLGNTDVPNGIKYMNNLYNDETKTGLIVSYNNNVITDIIGTTSHKIIKKIAQPLGLSNARNEIFNHIFGRTAYYSDNVGENLDKDIDPKSIIKNNNYMVTNMIDRKTGKLKSILKMKRLDLTNTTFKYNSPDEIDKFISANLCNGILVEENNQLLNRPAIFRNNIITESECPLLGRYKMKNPKGNNKSADWQQVFLPTLFTSAEMESIAEQIIMHSIKKNESKVSPLIRLSLIKQLASLLFNIQQAIFETPIPYYEYDTIYSKYMKPNEMMKEIEISTKDYRIPVLKNGIYNGMKTGLSPETEKNYPRSMKVPIIDFGNTKKTAPTTIANTPFFLKGIRQIILDLLLQSKITDNCLELNKLKERNGLKNNNTASRNKLATILVNNLNDEEYSKALDELLLCTRDKQNNIKLNTDFLFQDKEFNFMGYMMRELKCTVGGQVGIPLIPNPTFKWPKDNAYVDLLNLNLKNPTYLKVLEILKLLSKTEISSNNSKQVSNLRKEIVVYTRKILTNFHSNTDISYFGCLASFYPAPSESAQEILNKYIFDKNKKYYGALCLRGGLDMDGLFVYKTLTNSMKNYSDKKGIDRKKAISEQYKKLSKNLENNNGPEMILKIEKNIFKGTIKNVLKGYKELMETYLNFRLENNIKISLNLNLNLEKLMCKNDLICSMNRYFDKRFDRYYMLELLCIIEKNKEKYKEHRNIIETVRKSINQELQMEFVTKYPNKKVYVSAWLKEANDLFEFHRVLFILRYFFLQENSSNSTYNELKISDLKKKLIGQYVTNNLKIYYQTIFNYIVNYVKRYLNLVLVNYRDLFVFLVFKGKDKEIPVLYGLFTNEIIFNIESASIDRTILLLMENNKIYKYQMSIRLKYTEKALRNNTKGTSIQYNNIANIYRSGLKIWDIIPKDVISNGDKAEWCNRFLKCVLLPAIITSQKCRTLERSSIDNKFIGGFKKINLNDFWTICVIAYIERKIVSNI
jgi:hypothetical protein